MFFSPGVKVSLEEGRIADKDDEHVSIVAVITHATRTIARNPTHTHTVLLASSPYLTMSCLSSP